MANDTPDEPTKPATPRPASPAPAPPAGDAAGVEPGEESGAGYGNHAPDAGASEEDRD